MGERLKTMVTVALLIAPLIASSQQTPSLSGGGLESFREELRLHLPELRPVPVVEDDELIGFRVNSVVPGYFELGLREGDIVVLPGGPAPVNTLEPQIVADRFESLMSPGSTWQIRSSNGTLREMIFRPPIHCLGVPRALLESGEVTFC